MKKKIVIGLIAAVAIVAVATFVGGIEKDQVSSGDIITAKTLKKGPDLEVTDVSAVGLRIALAGSDYVPKINVDVVKVNFTVKNIGNEAVTEKFYTEIYVAESNKIEKVETTYLDPDECFTETVSFRATSASLRAKPVIVKVDADNAISELKEENNIKEAIAAIIS